MTMMIALAGWRHRLMVVSHHARQLPAFILFQPSGGKARQEGWKDC
ncbi:MAG: hypothetical protein K2X55_09260 [Burkholderiaceae bacterium]|nr:hypothetical protein [Burkholderiaceae bacterium]